MESKLNEKVSRLQSCQERKLQLEENIQRLQPQLRDMKNTLEKYTNSMSVTTLSTVLFRYLLLIFTPLVSQFSWPNVFCSL